MICPICRFEDTKVIDSRVASDGLSIRRRRECEKCGFRFSTFEEMEILDLTVVKRDGQKEIYSRDKLISGLRKALEKRPIDDEGFKKLVHNIERDIQQLKKSEVESNEIGAIAMKHLKDTDVVAFIRFASVYESFEDASDFKDTLNKIIDKSGGKRRRGVTKRNKNLLVN
jgi:transcriptional repressor NrdR